MMKPLHMGALALAFCLAACAGFDRTINNAVAWIDAPATQQAIGSLKSGVTAFSCAVADASEVAKAIESGVGAGQSLIGTDGKVYVASAATCTALGGTLGPQAVVP
ncbi:MAG: hypothetical protein ACLQL2_02555 [Methylovirgula sp.]